jgi:hypothetical protein
MRQEWEQEKKVELEVAVNVSRRLKRRKILGM